MTRKTASSFTDKHLVLRHSVDLVGLPYFFTRCKDALRAVACEEVKHGFRRGKTPFFDLGVFLTEYTEGSENTGSSALRQDL
ncbi:hypothetical protein EMGBS15_04620 [Filimonas sp.]|nr:hypothetical protein EMGBS15_04620 [Filimonas sp.]